MQSNAITMLGLLQSNNVYGEGRIDTGSACSTKSECKTKYMDVIYYTR